MYSRERAERIIIEAMRKALQIGFKPVTLGNAHVGVNAKKGGISAGLRRDTPLTVNIFDEGALKTAQLDMLQELFRRYGAEYSSAEAKTMLTTLIGGSIERYVKAVVKSIPLFGNLLYDDEHSLPVLAAAATYALGQVAVLRLEMDQPFTKMNLNAVKQVYQREFEQGKAVSRTLEQGQSNATVVLDFESARKCYDQACYKPISMQEDPFAISIEEMPSSSRQVSSSKKQNGLAEKFEQLVTLREKGILTEDEFQAQRQKLLNQL